MAQAFATRPYRPRLYGEPTVNAGLETYGARLAGAGLSGAFGNQRDARGGGRDRALAGLAPGAGRQGGGRESCASQQHQYAALGRDGGDRRGDGRRGHVAPALEAALERGARAVLITPRARNPTGCSLSEARARALARAGAPSGFWPSWTITSRCCPTQPIIRRCPRARRRWALVRSLTKALGPDIRVALVASDAATSRQLRFGWPRAPAGQPCLAGHGRAAPLGQTEVAQLMARAREGLRAPPRRPGRRAARAGPAACGAGRWTQSVDSAAGGRSGRGAGHGAAGWLLRHGGGLLRAEPVPGLRVTLSDIEPEQCAQLARDLRQSIA